MVREFFKNIVEKMGIKINEQGMLGISHLMELLLFSLGGAGDPVESL